MTDLISREAAIALLNKIPIEQEGCPRDQALDAAIEALTNMPSAEHVLPKTYEEIHKQSLDRRGRPVRENPTRDDWVVIP